MKTLSPRFSRHERVNIFSFREQSFSTHKIRFAHNASGTDGTLAHTYSLAQLGEGACSLRGRSERRGKDGTMLILSHGQK